MCLSSGRGCTVTPSAPKRCASMAAFTTSGLLPPRLFLSVANLLMFTESLVVCSIGRRYTVVTIVRGRVFNGAFYGADIMDILLHVYFLRHVFGQRHRTLVRLFFSL